MASHAENRYLLMVVLAQLGLGLSGVLAGFLADKPGVGMAVLWGALAAMANTLLIYVRMVYGDRPTYNARQHLGLMYRSMVERFCVVTAFFALGLLKLRLGILPVMLSFLVGQLMLIVVPVMLGMKSSKRWQAKP